jgi:hypothetical protein
MSAPDRDDPGTPAPAGEALRAAILATLDADPRTREPMNALVVWTEVGRALQGTLERKGGDAGLLREVISKWCRHAAGRTVDLERWAYRVEPADRLSATELAAALRGIEGVCGRELGDLERATGEDGGRAVFLTLARGWFGAGLDLCARLGAARGAEEADVIAALGGWCERFLPTDPSQGKNLGVLVDRTT